MRASFLRRSPLLLLAAALVALAVLFAPGAQPAQAQTTTVWSATLTVADTSGAGQALGCENPVTGGSCSSTSVLTDDDFTYGGVDYEVVWIELRPSSGFLRFELNKAIPADLKAALTLHLGSSQFPISNAALTQSDKRASWGNTGLSWSVGDTVSVSLTEPSPLPTVSLSASPTTVDEGGPVTITATLSEALSSSVTIPLSFTNGTAESSDYSAPRSVTINAGATTGTGAITTRQDADTYDETFTVALVVPVDLLVAGSPSQVEITIIDDDRPFNAGTSASTGLSVLPTDDDVQPVPPSQRAPTGSGASASGGFCYTRVGSPGNTGTEYVRNPDGSLSEVPKTSAYLRSRFACE